MNRFLGLVGLGLLLLLSLPSYVPAATTLHYFDCKQCHKSGMNIGAMGANNTCLQCHADGASWSDSTPVPAPWYNGTPEPTKRFVIADTSDLFGSGTNNPQMPPATAYTGFSHAWGVTDTKASAGAQAPNKTLYAGFYSRYNASTGKVTCSRCHNPHGDAVVDFVNNSTGQTTPDLLNNITRAPVPDGFPDGDGIPDVNPLANPQLLVRDATLNNAPMAADKMCRACHVDFDKPNSLLVNTHPVILDYAAAQAASPNDLRAQAEIDTFTTGHASKVQIVSGGVSCLSCHGVHFVDSNKNTADGQRAGLLTGPGDLLRSDGAHLTGGARNGATGTAQLRSNLCQSCHKYELHGQGTDNHMVGCLECHNGHDPASTTDYMLRSGASNGPVPTRFNRVNSGEQSVTFPTTFNTGNTRMSWADENKGGVAGFCEKCHGDCNSDTMVGLANEHAAGNQNQCTACHKHNDPADSYSFNRDATAATCGQCHGFPPYLNSPGDRPPDDGVDGGYAVNNKVAEGGPYDYVLSTTYEKDESKTGHKVHAGRDIPDSSDVPPGPGPLDTSVNDWYFVGAAGIDNCRVCHGFDAGATAGGHRINPTTRPGTFRDVVFYGIATTGGLTPAYNPNSPYTCSNVYCHTNGAPYNGASRPNRVYTRINTTPGWIGNGGSYANGGYGSIYGTGSRCAECHGNNVSTMTAGTGAQKSNSVAHLAHLGGTTTLNMGKTFSCSVCHVYTASSATALAINSMDGRNGQSGGTGGKHVNGLIDVNFDSAYIGGDLASSTFTEGTGVCSTYCHNVTGAGGAFTADWDVATDMQCDSCHGGKASDIAGDGGYGAISTGSHARHILTTGTGPKLACAECHGTGSDAGTHAGHFDGTVNMKVATNTAAFGSDSVSICKECHGYEVGEVLPVWGNSSTTDCATCHSGTYGGLAFNGKTPLRFGNAVTTGHNRPTASGAYGQSANPAANLNCSGCHITDNAGHWDGTTGDDMMLLNGGSFPASYTTNADKNNFCGACHGAAGTATVKNINTHRSKLCVACHNVHGDSNIQMIWSSSASQTAKDTSATGKYAANVDFTNATDFSVGNLGSYDEDEGAVGGGGEINSDDICATCHTVAAGTTHNERSGSTAHNGTGTHYQGGNCFTCHASHADATDAFRLGAGTACNDCHGFPPATGAHRKGTVLTDPELHSSTASNLAGEDRSDCAFCHTGADLYTYDLAADQAAGGARANHAVSQATRRSVLATSVGYNSTNFNCTTACHASTAGDGAWNDVNGLNCNACHYAAASPTSAGNVTAGNSEAVSATHNKHFDKNNMTCAQCHDVSYSPTITAIRGVLTHIIAPDYSGAGNDGTLVQGRANAVLDEATVTRSGMVYSGGAADAGGPNNTCTGGITTGCHASGTPDWDVTIPATSAGCVMCHTETNTAAYNPTSGVHDNSPSGPTVTGNAHDGNFDNGSGGSADCVTCHTASPTAVVANHINGTLNTGSAITVAASAGYTVATGDCATTCHSAGTTWRYKWATSAYNTNSTECANCHGDYTSGWTTGVAPHTEFPTRGNKHNNVGNLTYPCTDCHAIGSAGYKWTSKWDPTGTNSNHGDDKITMNQTAVNTFAIDTVPNPDRAGCTTSSCHQNDSAHNFRITTTAFTTQTVTGPNPDVLCSGCHGGYAPGGTSVLGYWPDGANAVDNGTEDNSGAHLKHMTVLAQVKYGETLTQLLTNNGNGTGDAKQKFLCAYCHTNPGSDGDHGVLANVPAEVNSMYAQWDLTRSTADNGVWSSANKTCATVDCHYNKTTPTTPTSYTWYSGSTSACIMCHVDVTAEAKHVAHTGAAATFGRTIGCADCHQAATNWASNTAPATGHLNGSYSIAGSVTFTYSAFSCGTNDCHEDGKGGPPKTNPYPWNGAALGNCTICHDATPTTDAHPAHTAAKVATYVTGCSDCHPAATNAAHINNSVTYASKLSAAPGNGSCTNTCHLSPQAGDWTGGAAAITCTDCHSGSGASAYIGGDKTSVSGPNYMPQYNMHLTVPTVSGKVHTDTGLSTTCDFCHSNMAAQSATHPNGTLLPDGPANTDRGMFAAWTDGSPGTCATTCHSAGTSWRYKWSATAGNTNGTECANCHGDYTSGWNTGVGHATNPARGNSSSHNSTGTLTYACTACHVIGATTGNYPWTTGTNDWKATDAGATTLHGDGKLTINSNSTTHVRNENPVGTWKSGCKGCHDGPSNDGQGADDGNHDYPVNILTAPSTVRWALQPAAGDVAATGGGCDGCHGGGGNMAPNGSRGNVWPDRPGKHSQHMAALTAKGITGTDACNYCHPYSSGSSYVVGEHNDASAPATMPNATSNYYRRIIGGANDSNGITNGSGTNYVTCSNIDCHFEQPVTPHWYTDDIAPAAVSLTAVAGPEPRSIKVSWNAPGDDNNVANTTPYVYDLRYGTSSVIATDFSSTTNYAGNLPAAYKQGSLSEAVIRNLNIGTTYYFSLKTRDTAGNWSAASSAASALPATDGAATPPAFGGANKAIKGDQSGTVYLTWTPAEDHSMPITYKVWRKAESAGALDMDVDSPLLTGVKGSNIVLTSAVPDSLVNDTIYNFGVRACDANNNCDSNDQIVSATPTAEPLVTKTNHTYRTNGSKTLVKDGAAGTGVLDTVAFGTTGIVFAPGANNTYSVTYYVDTFAVYLDTGNSSATVRAEIGYSTNGTNFTSLGVSKDITLGSRADRVYQFKLVDVAGKTITSGQRLAIRLSEPSTGVGVKAGYGSTAYRGDLTVAERIQNTVPSDPAVAATVSGANLNVTWTASTDTVDGLSDTVHYDLFGSDDNGSTYRYLIAKNIPAATTNYSWNTQEAGISGSATMAVKLLAGDGYGHYTGAGSTTNNKAVNNSADNVAPGTISDLVARARPKSGSVTLTWTAPGDDNANNGRAAYYDIRYSTAAITEGNFASATQCVNEPSPDFGGKVQTFEVTGLAPGTTYYFAIKTYDDGSPAKASAISTAKAVGTDQAVGGPRCGMCHTTAPSIVESVGNHKLHGFTLKDCTKCHGAAAETYGLDHQDGVLTMGYGPGGPRQGIISGNRIYYTNNGLPIGSGGDYIMYDDTDGFGGFGNGNYVDVGDALDDGTCINFGAMGVGGCHSGAGTDPDGGGTLFATLPTPTWTAAAYLNCASCHGNPARTTDYFYSRAFDAGATDQVKASPVLDNHGNYNLTDPDEKDRKYIGQHEKHLNYSFRFSKGDSCNLCHPGSYASSSNLDGKHANGDVDVKLDKVAAGENASWAPGTATTAGTCSNMDPESCHPSASSPKWDSNQSFDCVGCHNMGGTTPSHVTDPAGGVSAANDGWATDPMAGNCTYCHFGGHPRDTVGGTALILSNSSQVGINYKSGGIHLKASIGGRAARATEAELCWQCHDANGISEWGADTGSNNTGTVPPNASNYNYGTVTSSNWTTASWSSPVADFSYKTGAIQSTHSTSETGTSAVSGSMEAYSETKDTVDKIRCSNCHDVHNLNKAPNDSYTGQPYLRGTWIRNPYPEDGAPWGKTYAAAVAIYGAVPRAGGNEQGGFQIDQNNNYPTAGMSLATSAGLCTLCHGTNVDTMDKRTGENLWIGSNGHSNATLGGTASAAANIFGHGIGGRPAPSGNWADTAGAVSDVPDMGLQAAVVGNNRGYSYRNAQSYNSPRTPVIGAAQPYAYRSFGWGVTVDAGTTDIGYHAFTCSKCHNPHASRLPKLMITNCLDTRQNTWQSSSLGQGNQTMTSWTSPEDNGEKAATWNTAQNCHRYDSVDNVGGWNKVTPW